MSVSKRIQLEIQSMMRDNDLKRNYYSIGLVDDHCRQLTCNIRGAPDTTFQGGVFELRVTIPDTYPFAPPVCQFVTKVWHPNVSPTTGALCLDPLQEHSHRCIKQNPFLKDQWVPGISLASVLASIQSLLSSPEPDDPLDAVVTQQFRSKRKLYDKTAQYWTYIYAIDEKKRKVFYRYEFIEFDFKITTLMDKRLISRDRALEYLSCSDWDLDRAISSNI